MFDSPIQEIKDRLPILEVIQDYVPLKKAGTNYKGLCPFHNEKTASFMVSPSKQIWHCFGCGQGGDIFEFIKLSENVEFGEALKILADRAGVELRKPTPEQIQVTERKNVLYEINQAAADYFAKVLWESEIAKQALEYLRGRGLTDQTIKNWQLGWASDDFHFLENFLAKIFDKKDIELAGLIVKKEDGSFFDRFRGRIMFPIVNLHGQVVGFTARLLHEKPSAEWRSGKYINSPETPIYNKSRELYGLYQGKNLIRKENRCVLVEGNMDVLSLHQAGFAQAVASSGTALTETQLLVLKRFCEDLVFAFDQDSAGSGATKRALELALSLGFNVKIVDLGLAKDPDELVKKGIGLWQKAIDSAGNFLEFYFTKVMREQNSNTVEGKRLITKELAPLIFRIFDPVVKAHFVRKLATNINVSEQAIWDLIKKLSLPKPATIATKTEHKKSRAEILEEEVLGLSLNVKNSRQLLEFDPNDFSDNYREVLSKLKSESDLEIDRLKQKFPGIAEKLELLNFAAATELIEQGLSAEEELTRVTLELRKIILKRHMEKIAMELSVAEKRQDKDLLVALSQKFTALSQQINQLSK